jgi:hypothetical protein
LRDLALNANEVEMAAEKRCSVKLLVFGASMREGSMNDTLASHLKKQWVEFLGERPDDETTRVELGETAAV